MTNDRIHRSARRRKHRAMHAIFAALIMVSGSTAVVHAREVVKYAEIQPGHGSMRAPVGHRQPIQRDVAGARQARSDKKIIAQDNELLDLPSSQNHVAGADEVPPGENTLAKMIEEENARIDRLVRSICRGC
jgi:hypothetical protein